MEPLRVFPLPNNTMGIALLQDGSYVRTWWDEDSGLAGHQHLTAQGEFIRTIMSYVGMSLAASPTQQEVAFTSKNTLHIHHIGSGCQVDVAGYFRASAYFGSLVWSPDGEHIAIGGINPDEGYPEGDDWQLTIVTRTGVKVRNIGSAERVSHISWHADGQRIAYDDGKTSILVGALNKRYLTLDRTIKYSFRPTGHGAACVILAKRPQLVIQSSFIQDATVVAFFDSAHHDNLPHNLWWSPDGRFLLFNGAIDHHQGWHLYDAQAGTLKLLFSESDGYFTSPCWHAGSEEISFLSQRGIEVFSVAVPT